MSGTIQGDHPTVDMFGIFAWSDCPFSGWFGGTPQRMPLASKDGPKPICCVLVKGKPLARHHIFRSRVILDLIQISITKVTASGSERVERDATLMSL